MVFSLKNTHLDAIYGHSSLIYQERNSVHEGVISVSLFLLTRKLANEYSKKYDSTSKRYLKLEWTCYFCSNSEKMCSCKFGVLSLDILPAPWSGVTWERFALVHDGDSLFRFPEVPIIEKGNSCELRHNSCYYSLQRFDIQTGPKGHSALLKLMFWPFRRVRIPS